jgi:hypothetical protein
MSQQIVNLERAIKDLRAESAPEGARSRALDGISSAPRTNRWVLPGYAAGLLCIASVVVLTTTSRGRELSWADVQASMRDATTFHWQFTSSDGSRGEGWQSGADYGMVAFDSKERLTFELREDAEATYVYWAGRELSLPNAYHCGMLMATIRRGQGFSGRRNTIQELLSDRRTRVESHERPTREHDGMDVYTVDLYGKEHATVNVDASTGKIVRIERSGEVESFDYPDSIDPRFFSWKHRLSTGAPVADLRHSRTGPFVMPTPIATKDGVSLRNLFINESGFLIASWTGETYTRKHHRPVRVLGVRTGKPNYPPGPTNVRDQKVECLTSLNVPLLDKVGDRISIEIPTGPRTSVIFRNVPVSRLKSIP